MPEPPRFRVCASLADWHLGILQQTRAPLWSWHPSRNPFHRQRCHAWPRNHRADAGGPGGENLSRPVDKAQSVPPSHYHSIHLWGNEHHFGTMATRSSLNRTQHPRRIESAWNLQMKAAFSAPGVCRTRLITIDEENCRKQDTTLFYRRAG